jgi:hypothetical protein
MCLQWSGRTLKAEKAEQPARFTWFNAEAQDGLIRKFGDDSDFVRIRVDGLPPRQASDTLIGYEDVMAATTRSVTVLPGDPLAIAVDVAGESGGDKSIVLTLRGPVMVGMKELTNKTTTQLGDLVAAQVKTEVMTLPPETQIQVGVDTIGIGRGVYYHLQDVQQVQHLNMLDVSELPLDPTRFHRLRDQIYWELREAFVESRTIVIQPDEELIGQLTSIKWAEVRGKIKVQGKGSDSGIPDVKPLASSPDKMDALALAWFLYQHRCSRLPAHLRRRRREATRRPVSWKVR